MKITVESKAPRKLAAVIGQLEMGLFLPMAPGGVAYLSPEGVITVDKYGSLEDAMRTQHSHRKPVYEGDTVTLTF